MDRLQQQLVTGVCGPGISFVRNSKMPQIAVHMLT